MYLIRSLWKHLLSIATGMFRDFRRISVQFFRTQVWKCMRKQIWHSHQNWSANCWSLPYRSHMQINSFELSVTSVTSTVFVLYSTTCPFCFWNMTRHTEASLLEEAVHPLLCDWKPIQCHAFRRRNRSVCHILITILSTSSRLLVVAVFSVSKILY